MTEEVWGARSTTPDAIEAALRDMLRSRHAADEALVPARVLNLVVIVDRDWKGEIANRLEGAGRYHASRTVLCAVQDGRVTLDAVATVGDEERAPGTPRVMHESVVIDVGAQHLPGLRTIVDPILVDELPTVVWSPHGHDEAVEALLEVMDVVMVDSDDIDDPALAFERAQRLARDAYVVDLAWLRTTPWRERLAASFDLPARRAELPRIARLEVRHRSRSAASALLLVGWLASRLGWTSCSLGHAGGGLAGTLSRPGCCEPGSGAPEPGSGAPEPGEVLVALRPHDQDVPGLAGVTVCGEGGAALSLQRGRGGLEACEVSADGAERVWRILGASRGEGGILGEGIRQALLRDQTYEPALDSARALCTA